MIGLLCLILGGISLSRMKNELSLANLKKIKLISIALLMIAGCTMEYIGDIVINTC